MKAPRPAEEIIRGIHGFRRLEVLVVGDLFLDEYVEGEMFEISREAPVPVIRLESRRLAAGAAGNLASSLGNLGARVRVVGVVGDDSNGRALLDELEEKGIDSSGVIEVAGERTFTYTKIRAGVQNAPSREVLRIDTLPRGPASGALEARLLAALKERATGVRGIIVLDQVHHVVTRGLLDELPAIARANGALLHGSSRERVGEFRSFDLVVPNDVEASAAVGGDGERPLPLEKLGEELRAMGDHRRVLLTLGPEGMALFPGDGSMERLPTLATEVVDVTGAGDAVAATALLGNLSGWDLRTVAWTASLSAALAIARVGTHHVSRAELEEAVRERGG